MKSLVIIIANPLSGERPTVLLVLFAAEKCFFFFLQERFPSTRLTEEGQLDFESAVKNYKVDKLKLVLSFPLFNLNLRVAYLVVSIYYRCIGVN